MGIIIPIILLISSYLLGSIPWALIVSKFFFGKDIRDFGSKNMGATNVLRIFGLKYGIIVFILDAFKASIVILLFKIGLLDYELDWMVLKIHPLIYGVVALIGHMFPVFASFKGGKGVSCASGIILVYNPIVFLIAFLTFFIVLKLSNYISLSSLSAVTVGFIASFIKINNKFDFPFIIFMGIAMIFLFITHIPNIKRLIKKEENKVYILNKKK